MSVHQKTIIITGGTSGIGLATAEALAVQGHRLVLIGRDRARGEAALARLRQVAPAVEATIHYADLYSLADIRRLAAELLAAVPHIDVLINNAGALFDRRELTADGLEKTFALNHMSYFLLTALLEPALRASAPARIVNVSSRAHQGARLDFDDLQSANGYGGMKVYGRSKLANILFTRELARRLAGTGVTANCLHPGFVASRFGETSGGIIGALLPLAKRLAAIGVEDGAKTSVYLATSPEVEGATGGYYVKSRLTMPSAAARDDAAARRLWLDSGRIAGIAP